MHPGAAASEAVSREEAEPAARPVHAVGRVWEEQNHGRKRDRYTPTYLHTRVETEMDT